MRRFFGLMVFLCIAMLTFATPTFCAEIPAEGTSPDMNQNYTLGIHSAERNYMAIGPFVTGFSTGMILPITTGAGAALCYNGAKHSNGAGIAGGVAAFVLTLWCGHETSKHSVTSQPDYRMPALTGQDRESFEQGYSQRVGELEKRNFSIGVALGVAYDIFIVFQFLGGFELFE
jgi:hypothetical protein